MTAPRQPPAIFYQLLFAMIVSLGLGLFTLLRGHKQKDAFLHATGAIVSLSNSLDIEGYLNLNNKPIRYLQIQGQPRFYRLFIGKDLDGSKPDFQRIDDLRIGDVITIYYDETAWSSTSDLVSNLAYFVDKGEASYFIRGGLNNSTIYYFITICASIIVISVLLKRTGKIS